MIGDRTYPWAWKQATGTLRFKNLLQHTAGYTETHKKVAAGTTTAVLAATATSTSATSVTTGFSDIDVPRVITVTAGGTAADIATCTVTVTGTNIEGATITEDFSFSANTAATKTGTKAFKTVTQLDVPAQDGNGATYAVGTANVIGLNHRLVPNKTTIVVFQDTAIDGTAPTLQAAPSASTVNGDTLELNTVTPATAPDGTTFLTVVYWYHNVVATSVNDNPVYGTSTSTSSSTSTSTTTSTSTSTSSTSTSTSSTSTSTSSTSTSTTTTP